MRHRSRFALGLAVLSLALGVATPGLAEIEVIEVTSQKRTSTLQETNISLTALTASDLEERGVVRVDELTEYIPKAISGATKTKPDKRLTRSTQPPTDQAKPATSIDTAQQNMPQARLRPSAER